MNGVINVMTRSPRDTHGSIASVGGGNRQQAAAFRYGATFGGSHFRAYGKFTNLERDWRADGNRVRDGRHWLQASFRTDWGDASHSLTLQGDPYRVQSEDRGSVGGVSIGRAELSGVNLFTRWTHQFGEASEFQLQAYLDHVERDERILSRSDLFDVEIQHPIARGRPPVFFENKINGPAYGLEGWATSQLLSTWRFSGGITILRKDLRLEPDSTDVLGTRNPQLSNDPKNSGCSGPPLVPGEITNSMPVSVMWGTSDSNCARLYPVDLRYAWHVHPQLQISLVGQHLVDRRHPEFNALPGRSEFERGIFLGARWSR